FRQSGGEPGGKSGRTAFFRKAGHAHKLRLVSQVVELKVKAESVANGLAIWPDKMTSVPRGDDVAGRMCRNNCLCASVRTRRRVPIWFVAVRDGHQHIDSEEFFNIGRPADGAIQD